MDSGVHVDERQRLLASDVIVVLSGRHPMDMSQPVDVGAAVLVGMDHSGHAEDRDRHQA
jgi:hypothetical protein